MYRVGGGGQEPGGGLHGQCIVLTDICAGAHIRPTMSTDNPTGHTHAALVLCPCTKHTLPLVCIVTADIGQQRSCEAQWLCCRPGRCTSYKSLTYPSHTPRSIAGNGINIWPTACYACCGLSCTAGSCSTESQHQGQTTSVSAHTQECVHQGRHDPQEAPP